ncbi:MAG: hypothetical protein NE334_16370 [Lentisphaeraceae bacterium]|nr:hypothetical protein [Lentisphaeraceae bacterium]
MTNLAKGNNKPNKIATFWSEWQKINDDLLIKCLYFTKNNLNEAEELLSESMLKAILAFNQQHTQIRNFKSWASHLTRNCLIDKIRSSIPKSTLDSLPPYQLAAPEYTTPNRVLLSQELESHIFAFINYSQPKLSTNCS